MPAKAKTAAATSSPAPAIEKKRRGRRPKDPNAPKHPLSAFMLFSNKERAKVREKRPELTFREMGDELGKMWRALGDKGQAPFKAEADKLKAVYRKEKASYTPPPEVLEAKKARAGKPRTALHIFLSENEAAIRASLADPTDVKAFAEAGAAKFAELTPAQTAAFEARAQGEAALAHRPKPKKISAAKRERALKKQKELVDKQAKLSKKLQAVNEELAVVMEIIDLSGDNPIPTLALPIATGGDKAPARGGAAAAALAMWPPAGGSAAPATGKRSRPAKEKSPAPSKKASPAAKKSPAASKKDKASPASTPKGLEIDANFAAPAGKRQPKTKKVE